MHFASQCYFYGSQELGMCTFKDLNYYEKSIGGVKSCIDCWHESGACYVSVLKFGVVLT